MVCTARPLAFASAPKPGVLAACCAKAEDADRTAIARAKSFTDMRMLTSLRCLSVTREPEFRRALTAM
jgi:hypothetical protein